MDKFASYSPILQLSDNKKGTTQKMTTRNELFAKGKIVRIFKKKTGASILIVKSFSGKRVYLKFVVPAEKNLNYHEDDVVSIEGYVRAYSHNGENGWSVHQYPIVDRMRKENKSTSAFNDNAELTSGPLRCDYTIKGTVVGYSPEQTGWARLTVRVDEDHDTRKTSYVHISMKASDRFPVIKKGDMISASCNIETPVKVIRGEKTYFQDYIVNDIVVVNQAA